MSFIAITELRSTGAEAELEHAVEGYLASLQKQGHTWGDPTWTWTDNGLAIVCTVPLEGALDPGDAGETVKTVWARLESLLAGPIEWRLVGKPAVSRRTTQQWSRAAAFCLQTILFEDTSPLIAADTREAAPLYLLPLEDTLREGCASWMHTYRAHDWIWLDSSELEMAAYSQLSEPDADLSRRGRALCESVERATGVPTYYFLYRYYVVDPLCPTCKRPWVRPATEEIFGGYLVCASCRLVTQEGLEPRPSPLSGT